MAKILIRPIRLYDKNDVRGPTAGGKMVKRVAGKDAKLNMILTAIRVHNSNCTQKEWRRAIG